MKKITIAVPLDKEYIITTLMNHIKFNEVERVATGGMMSEPQLLMTFMGNESDYRSDFYVVVPANAQYSYYYSLNAIDGYFSDNLDDFVKYHNSKQKQKLEILNF